MGHHPEVGQHLQNNQNINTTQRPSTDTRNQRKLHSVLFYRVPAYHDEGPFEEDAELRERTGGKAVFLQSSRVLWRATSDTTETITTSTEEESEGSLKVSSVLLEC